MLKTLKDDMDKKRETQPVYNISIKDSVLVRSKIGGDNGPQLGELSQNKVEDSIVLKKKRIQ